LWIFDRKALLDKLITKTLADIYLRQGDLQEAHRILVLLAEKNPLDREIWNRLEEVNEKLRSHPAAPELQEGSAEDRIRILEDWLLKIRTRRKR
jgi:predicted Zn-dependent protease